MSPIGPWPTEPPFAPGERVLVWHEGTTASAVLAASCEAFGLAWEPFVAHVPGAPARALEAAFAQLAALGRARPRVHALAAPLLSPPGWAALAPEAGARGLAGVALPVTDGGPPWAREGRSGSPVPLALQLRAIEEGLAPWGPLTLWAPLAGLEFLDVARLALALGVELADTWDCVAESACGRCRPCAERARAGRRLGLPASR